MKKTALAAGIILLSCVSVFSLDLSGGAGINGDFIFNQLKATLDTVGGGEYAQTYNHSAIGLLLFFDAQYLEADLEFYGSWTRFNGNKTLSQWTGIGGDWEISGVGLGIGFLGKYPFVLSDTFTFFPLLGLQFDIQLANNFTKDYGDLAHKGDNYGIAFDWSSITIKTGVGGDYSFNDTVFLRGELLFDWRLNNRLEDAYIKEIASGSGETPTNLNLGFSVKIAVGFKLPSVSTGGDRRTERRTLTIRDVPSIPTEPAGGGYYQPENAPGGGRTFPSDDEDNIYYPQ